MADREVIIVRRIVACADNSRVAFPVAVFQSERAEQEAREWVSEQAAFIRSIMSAQLVEGGRPLPVNVAAVFGNLGLVKVTHEILKMSIEGPLVELQEPRIVLS